MTTRSLVNRLLDHPDPWTVYAAVEQTLKIQQQERIKFRKRLKLNVKAEYILGEIVLHGPASRGHSAAVSRISTLLTTHCTLDSLGEVCIEKAVIESERNDLMPDVSVWLQERAKDFTPDMKYYPAPDLVVEALSKSTEDRDRGIKYQDYLATGVSEYWIVDHRTERVEQYLLDTGYDGANVYRKTEHELEDKLTSTVLQELSVPVASFFYPKPFAEALRQLG